MNRFLPTGSRRLYVMTVKAWSALINGVPAFLVAGGFTCMGGSGSGNLCGLRAWNIELVPGLGAVTRGCLGCSGVLPHSTVVTDADRSVVGVCGSEPDDLVLLPWSGFGGRCVCRVLAQSATSSGSSSPWSLCVGGGSGGSSPPPISLTIVLLGPAPLL